MVVRVQTADFDISTEIAKLTEGDLGIGAIATFTGRVRARAGGAPLTSMTLEHYPDMTEGELTRIEDEAGRRFQLSAATIIHRVGELKPGDNIVLVICCAPHRKDAFDACAFVMDYLKTRAPFWKKETGADGQGHWVDARTADDDAAAKWRDGQN